MTDFSQSDREKVSNKKLDVKERQRIVERQVLDINGGEVYNDAEIRNQLALSQKL